MRIGDREDFNPVRTALRQPGFDEASVYRALRQAGFVLEDDVAGAQPSENGTTDFGPLVALFC